MTKLTITGTNHKGNPFTHEGPEVGSIICFAAEPYHFGKMQVDAVEVIDSQYIGERFKITGTVIEGDEVSRLFGSVGRQSIAGRELELWCRAQDGEVEGLPFWRYVYPV